MYRELMLLLSRPCSFVKSVKNGLCRTQKIPSYCVAIHTVPRSSASESSDKGSCISAHLVCFSPFKQRVRYPSFFLMGNGIFLERFYGSITKARHSRDGNYINTAVGADPQVAVVTLRGNSSPTLRGPGTRRYSDPHLLYRYFFTRKGPMKMHPVFFVE